MTNAQRRWEKKIEKLQHRIKVTFENTEDKRAIAPAFSGQGYDVSQEDSGLRPGQIAYRMKLAREYLELPKGMGIRRAYSKGELEVNGVNIPELVRTKMMPTIQALVLHGLVKHRKHPTPKVSEEAA